MNIRNHSLFSPSRRLALSAALILTSLVVTGPTALAQGKFEPGMAARCDERPDARQLASRITDALNSGSREEGLNKSYASRQ